MWLGQQKGAPLTPLKAPHKGHKHKGWSSINLRPRL